MPTTDQLRQLFLDFFQQRGHQVMPSSSLIPAQDPTLMLTTAGMVQFKPYFTGEMAPPHPRLASVQKCFRATDIDQVGDATHLTFFEMLGNFSVGGYFKAEAIAWALEFVTSPPGSGGLGLPRERFAMTVFEGDNEAFELWRRAGIPASRIYRFGEKDNWWGPAGSEGPCGPCSELHYDFGTERGCGQPDCGPNCANLIPLVPLIPLTGLTGLAGQRCARFVELWNLVFMQYYQDREGKRTPLPKPNIDTGMGLERLAAVMQGKATIFETDLFQPVVQRVSQLFGKAYGQDPETDKAIRVVAEHARSAAFLIADGVAPSNEGRGYVLRRVIRRGLRYARKLGLGTERVLPQVAETVIAHVGHAYPELVERKRYILETLGREEEGFGSAVFKGELLLNGFLAEVPKIGRDLQQLEDELNNLEKQISERSHPQIVSDLRRQVVGRALALFKSLVTVSMDRVSGSVEAILKGQPSNEEIHGALMAREFIVDRFTPDEFESFQRMELPGQLRETRGRLSRTREHLLRAQRELLGQLVFFLHDTYGFPIEETQEIAREHGLEVDLEGFERKMEEQRQRGRAAAHFVGAGEEKQAYEALGLGAGRFVGYDALSARSQVSALLKEGQAVAVASAGEVVEVVLQATPFYAEGGGQLGDRGTLQGPDGLVRVEDTQAPLAGLTVHHGVVQAGMIAVGQTVDAQVDPQRRADCARNHTATHLLHAALRQVLGPHVRQGGSRVAPDRLRFDFTHLVALSPEELAEVQGLVNEKVRQNVPVTKQETTYTQAIGQGALAFFGDRYGARVRVIGVNGANPFSLEVCGGTHVDATGEVGYIQVLSEGSIGSGMRRLEAVSGRGAEQVIGERLRTLEAVARRLQTAPHEAEARLASVLEELEQVRKRVAALELALARQEASSLLPQARQVKGLSVVVGRVAASSSEALRETGDWLKNKLDGGVVALGTIVNDQPLLVVMASAEAVRRGIHAGQIAKEAAQAIRGGGGGNPELGQAGGKLKEGLGSALALVEQVVAREVRD